MNLRTFPDRVSASRLAAEMLATAVATELSLRPRATLVVSGGSTPAQCFAHLAETLLPWERVSVSVTDERCVPADHPDSNERMVRQRLLIQHASRAHFVALDHVPAPPFAAVLLGMGADGHFASLFPDAANLDDALSLEGNDTSIAITTANSPYPRLSMTLSRLVNTQHLILLAFGADKRAVLECPNTLPVARLIEQTRTPLQILWAP